MSTEHTPAEVLAHYWCGDQARGRHGILEFDANDRYRQISTERAERVIAALALAGYAVVELPEPDGIRESGEPYWDSTDYVESESDAVYVVGSTGYSTPARAREFAAALLAAANRAEAQS